MNFKNIKFREMNPSDVDISFKSAVALMLILLVVMLGFVSCGGKADNDGSGKTQGTNVENSEDADKNGDASNQDNDKESGKTGPAKSEVSVDKPPAKLVENFELPGNTEIELWSLATDWSGGNFNKAKYEIHLLSNESVQDLTEYYKGKTQDPYAHGYDEEFVVEGTMSGHDCKITIKDEERTLTDDSGKPVQYTTEIVMKFPAIVTEDEGIDFDSIFSYDFIDIYKKDSSRLIGVSYTKSETDLIFYSEDAPENVFEYYEKKMSKFDGLKQEGNKADFSGQNLLGYVQLSGSKGGYEVSVVVRKNQNPETVDRFKSGTTIHIRKK